MICQYIRTTSAALAFICTAIVITSCSSAPKLPPPRPAADMCDGDYKSYHYTTAAAAVESIENLRSHNFNEARFAERCLLDPNRKGSPR